MSEWGQDGAGAQQAADDGVTAGALLRRAREAAGLHVAALAVSLKVPVRKLEALEDNRWDVLPDVVFVRALASSVCRTLKIDPQPVLERLPQTSTPRLVHDGEGINTPFRAPSDGAGPTWFDQLTRPVFLAVFALLLGALIIILLPNTPDQGKVAAVTNSAETVVVPPPAVVPEPAPQPVAQAAPTPIAAPVPAPVAAVATPAPAAPVIAKSASAAATPASAPAAKASAPVAAASAVAAAPAGPASGIVVFRTKGASWIEVTDAKGVVAMRRELQANEAAGASGVLPLQVTIGRVDHTDVQVRGKPFDLRPVSKDNVARFTVK